MLKDRWQNVQDTTPLIHNITNYVTVNDCANILLACGGSPIMADAINEVEDITSICDGLNINIGTLNERTIASMFRAGKKANALQHPVLLDPVGAGASDLRTSTALQLLEEIKFAVIRGNISEIKTLVQGSNTTQGVDANVADQVSEATLGPTIAFAKEFSKKTGAIIAITGAIDIVANAEKAYVIRNGHQNMSKITGTGCMLSAMTSAYIAANRGEELEATAAAVCAMGLCGEIGYRHLKEYEGNSTYRNRIIDAVDRLTGEELESGARYEIR